MLEILQYPFMQRALIVGVLLSVGLAYLGVFVVLKRMAFYSDGIAHASLAGVAAGLVFGMYPLYAALIFSVLFAVFIYFLEERTTLAPDSLIGILFTASMSLGLIMMSLGGGYRPELTSFLFGSILTITVIDTIIVFVVSVILGGFFLVAHKGMMLMSLDRDMAYVSGIRVRAYQLSMYIILSLSVVLGVKVAGVVLVSALLIIPVSTVKLVSTSLRSLIIGTVCLAPLSVVCGIVISFEAGLPTGPTIVLVGALLFFVTFVFALVTRRGV